MDLKRILKLGDTGQDVGAVQSALSLAPDGIFGTVTQAAIEDFQKAYGLVVDGLVGPLTWAALMAPRPLPSAKLDAVGRLIRFAGQGKYVLGAGGTNPRQATPFTWRGAQYGSDCIGAVMWALGCPRHHPAFPEYEGDINTDSALMDAGIAGLNGKGDKRFFSPLDGPMHSGVICIYRSVWRRDLPEAVVGTNGAPGDMMRMGHVGMIVGWTGLKDPERPQDTPWDGHTASLITVECCARMPAVRMGQNVNFIDGTMVHGVVNPDWGVKFITFNGPVET